ncbi:MAG TPA: FAD-dependent monooxygenase [Acidiferrobacteraceae bacterium]|nr:FAD-dependent monooxygenase [Acidiferrobacteraceae bacterium]
MTDSAYDALILGAGPSGSCAAILLAQAGWNVALVEQSRFPRAKVCGEFISASNAPVLRALGLEEVLGSHAGPPVRQLAVLRGQHQVLAPMPAAPDRPWGYALNRALLDTVLLQRACAAGATLWTPWKAVRCERHPGRLRCLVRARPGGAARWLSGRIVIAAHGSWEAGALPSQISKQPANASDLLAFKAHFTRHSLPPERMALFVAPGAYGGLVTSDTGALSMSCCVRRKTLQQLRAAGDGAGAALEQYLCRSVTGVARVLRNAERQGPWLAAGPLRTGWRAAPMPGLFLVGNTAGEAHPLIAEGISMALQSAALLAQLLAASGGALGDSLLAAVEQQYRARWRAALLPRLRWSGLLAALALHPSASAPIMGLLRTWPGLLTWSARRAGKVARPRMPEFPAA